MTTLNLKIGQIIETQDGRQGTVRYIGTIHVAPGEWCGLELPDTTGKNDGSVKGERYFTCPAGHGIFVRKESAVKIVRQSTSTLAASTTPALSSKTPATSHATSAVKTRPSSILTAEATRKRQSLLSNGSSSQVGSRASLRSPTKSPVKPAVSSAGSTASNSRTGTPATTTRATDTTTKSRIGTAGRPSMGPPATTTTRTSTSQGPKFPLNTAAPVSKFARPSLGASKPSLATTRPASTTTVASRSSARQISTPTARAPHRESLRSPTIDEEVRQEDMPNMDGEIEEEAAHDERGEEERETAQDEVTRSPVSPTPEPKPRPLPAAVSHPATPARNRAASTVESRAAQQKEIEQMKVKVRNLEKARDEDQNQLRQIDTWRNDKERYETIIQALQKKLRSNSEELKTLRTKCEEAEAKAAAVPQHSGEIESELELATLDKEMAEERADSYEAELEALKGRHEELELEVEILREENRELGSMMSPEEKATAGWLQMERETERLREALVLLRDVSQEKESDLKYQIKDMRKNLEEAEEVAAKYDGTTERLTRSEETTRHLMEQLEAAESNEEIVEALETQREQHMNHIEQLRKQIQELEEHVQVTDELEIFHVDEEKRLLSQLDERDALLGERDHRAVEQQRIVEDLEYTLSKFRDVVQGLQNDIDELRRTREISESEAHEMGSKSRAMMDLNMRLQNSAAKTQTKLVDVEMGKLKAEIASRHAEILSLFVPDSYEMDKNSVLSLLMFGRVRSKAQLAARMLGDRLRERMHLSSGDELLVGYEIVERLEWISGVSDRFEKHLSSCSPEQFMSAGNAVFELEPVERCTTTWIEALRKDEVASVGPEQLRRVQEILTDLVDKHISDGAEARANELVSNCTMVEVFTGTSAAMLTALLKLTQSKLGPPKDEDEDSLSFDKKMDQLGNKTRTVRYLCGKVTQELKRFISSSVCPGETAWSVFAEAEEQAKAIAQHVRQIGTAIFEELGRVERESTLTYTSVMDTVTSTSSPGSDRGLENESDNALSQLASSLSTLQSQVDLLSGRVSDLNNTVEFESHAAPWVVRARQLKSSKTVSAETQEELSQLTRRNAELGREISEKEKTIEEMKMRVELAEKRMKDTKAKDAQDKALKEEISSLTSYKQQTEVELETLKTELGQTRKQMTLDQQELTNLKQLTINGVGVRGQEGQNGAGSDTTARPAMSKAEESLVLKHMNVNKHLLESEIASLQSVVRYLRQENRSLRVPVQEKIFQAARDSWLDPHTLKSSRRYPSTSTSAERLPMMFQGREGRRNTSLQTHALLQKEAGEVRDCLIDVAKSIRPVKLKAGSLLTSTLSVPRPTSVPTTTSTSTTGGKGGKGEISSWRALKDSPRYQILQQQEEVEKWEAWRTDLMSRAKLFSSSSPSTRGGARRARTSVKATADAGMLSRKTGIGIGLGIEEEKKGTTTTTASSSTGTGRRVGVAPVEIVEF